MVLSNAATALQILNGTWTAIKNMREQVQVSTDNDLKARYGELLDGFNDLRLLVIQLSDENEELRKAQMEKPAAPVIRQVGETNYYYVGAEGPYCQPCYDKDRKLARLSPIKETVTGNGRRCNVCKQF